MEHIQRAERAIPQEDAIQAITVYLTQRTQLSEPEARQEARAMIASASSADIARAARLDADQLANPWWALALRGLLAIVVGALFLTRPVSALAALVMVFGAWTFVDGVLALIASVTRYKSWTLAFAGLIGIAVGSFVMFRPGIGVLLFYVMVAIWAMGHGISEIALGARGRREGIGSGARTGLVVVGVLSFLFGLFMLAAPQFGLVALGAYVGIYALLFGGALVALAFPLRRAQRAVAEIAHAH